MSEDEENVQDPDADLPDGYQTFCQYVSLKNHFNSSYNWKKYGGKISIPREAYEKRRDKKFFRVIQKKFTPLERNQIFLANFVYDKHLWIGEFLADHCIGIWHDWTGRIGRMEYQFEEDLKKSLDEIQRRKGCSRKEALKALIRKPKDTHPLVLRFVWGGMFGIESYLLLSLVLDLRNVYRSFLVEDRLWSDFEYKIEKYEYFLRPKINKQKTTEILKQVTKE